MKKWFNWQLKNQVKDTRWDKNGKALCNIKSDIDWFAKYVIKGYLDQSLESYFDNVFYRQDWVLKASSSTEGLVSAAELESWMHDEEMATLMDRQGLEYIVNFDRNIEEKIKNDLGKSLNLIPESIQLRIHIQRPGQMFALHFDRNKYQQFDVSNSEHAYETESKIFIVFLNDQSIGQVFQIGDVQATWKAGDVFSWSQVDVPHGSANFGLENRFSIILTGFKVKS